METKKFAPLVIEPAENGVIVRPTRNPGMDLVAEPRHVFNDFAEFTAWLREQIVESA